MQYGIYPVLHRTGLAMSALLILATLGVFTSTVPNSFDADEFLKGGPFLLPSQSKAQEIDPATPASIAASYGKLPLSFEINNGQVDDSVRFLSRGNGYTLFLTSAEVVLSLRCRSPREKQQPLSDHAEMDESKKVANNVIRLKSIGSNPNPKITGIDELPSKSNYFMGNNPAKWHTDISNCAKVEIEDVYPGIDLAYYGNQRQLEYDWIVARVADPKTIGFEVEGKSNPKNDAQSGDLHL